MSFLRTAEELSVGLNSPVEDSPFLLSPTFQTVDCVILLSEALFATQGSFFASKTFTWYHYCSQIWSGCGSPEAKGQERAYPHTLSLPWQGIEYTI